MSRTTNTSCWTRGNCQDVDCCIRKMQGPRSVEDLCGRELILLTNHLGGVMRNWKMSRKSNQGFCALKKALESVKTETRRLDEGRKDEG